MTAETTLCTCIEAGALEEQVMLLAESLRRFGGRYADLPLVAVRPRAGPRLAGATRRLLASLNVELVEKNLSAFPWWAMANKPATMEHVDRTAKTPHVTWIDGDMVVLQEPGPFAPPPGIDFIARAGEAHDVASSGHDDRAEFWQRLCARLDMRFEDFPDVTSYPDEKPIKAYWQGGLLTARREVRFGKVFGEAYAAVLTGDIASKLAGTYHVDQVSVALAVQKGGFTQAHYDPRMNFNVNALDKELSLKIPISDVWIMQYHGSLWPKDYAWTKTVLAALPADRRALIDKYAPFTGGGKLLKLKRKLYQLPRQRTLDAYEKRVVRY